MCFSMCATQEAQVIPSTENAHFLIASEVDGGDVGDEMAASLVSDSGKITTKSSFFTGTYAASSVSKNRGITKLNEE